MKGNKSSALIRFVDVGARFGLHPAFKGIQRALKTLLIEADPEECARLQVRYADVLNVQIVNAFVGNRSQSESNSQILNLYKHPGGNSKFKADATSPYWDNLRPGTKEIQGTIAVPAVDLDSCVAHYLQGCDFLKIDVEGAELEVLAGAKEVLSRAIGVRIEVLFNSLYDDLEETFSRVHDELRKFDFFLLKYDLPKTNAYAPFSKFRGVDNFGILIGGDALYLKNLDYLKTASLETRLKAAIFAATSNTCDLALHLMYPPPGGIALEAS